MIGRLVKCLALVAGSSMSAASMPAATIQVFAAASLSDSLKEIGAAYQARTGNQVAVVFNFGASSLLARQIEEGASADLFFSADEAKMDRLQKQGLILTDTRTNRLSNSLVIVVAADSDVQIRSGRELADPKVKRIALADPKAVPAGLYAKAYLEKLGLWSAIAPKVVPTDNVRAALAAVESGNVEAAMVYRTDASISRKVKVACAIAVEEGPPIRYPVAVLKTTRQLGAAEDFLRYLGSDAAGRIFEKYGFIVLNSTLKPR